MPSSICSVDTWWVELPSPLMMLDRPTMAMPAYMEGGGEGVCVCGGGGGVDSV